jgi:Gamma-glutamyl cyclotransferase, AIG2-like
VLIFPGLNPVPALRKPARVTLHFAYGSNMSREPMQRRCPGAQPLGPSRLDNWRFVITQDRYASVVPTPGTTVHGVLWRLTPRDLAALHAYERLGTGLYGGRTLAVRHRDQLRRARVYVGRTDVPGRPLPGYQEDIVAAARAWGFPPAYVAELEAWLPSAEHGADRRMRAAAR